MFIDIFIALISNTPFKLAYTRARHIRNGHPFNNSILVDKLVSESHPHTCKDYVYTVNLRKCECGLIFFDNGIEARK